MNQPVLRIDRAFDGQLDAEAMPVQPRALVPFGDAREAMSRFEAKLVDETDVHGAANVAFVAACPLRAHRALQAHQARCGTPELRRSSEELCQASDRRGARGVFEEKRQHDPRHRRDCQPGRGGAGLRPEPLAQGRARGGPTAISAEVLREADGPGTSPRSAVAHFS